MIKKKEQEEILGSANHNLNVEQKGSTLELYTAQSTSNTAVCVLLYCGLFDCVNMHVSPLNYGYIQVCTSVCSVFVHGCVFQSVCEHSGTRLWLGRF